MCVYKSFVYGPGWALPGILALAQSLVCRCGQIMVDAGPCVKAFLTHRSGG